VVLKYLTLFGSIVPWCGVTTAADNCWEQLPEQRNVVLKYRAKMFGSIAVQL
jgi:hypothetical protein